MRLPALASGVVACAATAVCAAHQEPDEIVHPIVGLGPVLSADGPGGMAEFGIGVVPFMVRASLAIGGWSRPSFVLLAARGDWSFELTDALAGYAGAGIGVLGYGDAGSVVVTPEIGAILGARRTMGRVFCGLSLMLSPDPQVIPPKFLASIVFSL